MAFSILTLVCVLYQESIQENPLAPANTEVLAYNLQGHIQEDPLTPANTEVLAGTYNGPVGSIPGPAYPACPLGSGFSYELALNVCYKRVTSSSPTSNATCVLEGGSDLLKIDTQEKLDFFKQLVPAGQYTFIRGDRLPSTGEWVCWEGGSARPLPIIEWSPGQPDNGTTGQNCLTMDATGQRDINCN